MVFIWISFYFNPEVKDVFLRVVKITPETLKYWVRVQRKQCYLMGRRCLFSFGWPPF